MFIIVAIVPMPSSSADTMDVTSDSAAAGSSRFVWVGQGVWSDKSTYGKYDDLTGHYSIKNTGSSKVKYIRSFRLYDTYDEPDRLVRTMSEDDSLGAGETHTGNFWWNAPWDGWKEHKYKTVLRIEYMGGALEKSCYHRVVY
jgi:hypothetical protein